ncbi:uncharacterized protein N7483_010349 [Penicillium malachiteum]|uniref:uncharacterized protein n=1 Tax=Penicillium malachiteum TaxID=1324776 RepID=UPI002547F6DF|nr:uncharacterized protein N7483_010349 [Penicillium malachiteum]KAJ5713168.1 hypothetical protein N7483_010349 [Penicillium malachiteum]
MEKNGLLEARDMGLLTEHSLQEQLGSVLRQHQRQSDVVRVLRRDKRNIAEDLIQSTDSDIDSTRSQSALISPDLV